MASSSSLSPPFKVALGVHERYTREKVKAAFAGREEYEVQTLKSIGKITPSVHFQWLEYEDIDWNVLEKNQTRCFANSYCIRKGLIRKSQMAYCMHKYIAKRPDSILKRAIPETFLFELDDPYYFEESMNDVFEVAADLQANAQIAEDDPNRAALTKKFILKPSITNKAAEILVFDSEETLRALFEDRYERECGPSDDEDGEQDEDEEGEGRLEHIREWVIQRYMDRPLLLNKGRKFHVRTYVLAVGEIKIYVYNEMLALFASKPYSADTLSDRLQHITNTCVQADAEEFDEEDVVKLFWELSKEENGGAPVEKLQSAFEEMKQITAEVFNAVSSEVTVFQPMPNSFELFGFDFLIDEDYHVHFLEANSFPDFKQTGERLDWIISELFKQVVSVAVDPFFGVEPIHGTEKMHLVLEKQLRARK